MFSNSSIVLLSLCLLMACSSSPSTEDPLPSERAVAVMAYYVAEKDYRPQELPLDQLSHIIFSFTNVIDGEMQFRHGESGEKLRLLVAQKERHPDLKVMIACGGWTAGGFSDMALTEESRGKFIQSTVAFVEEYGLDGVDIDWEYPGLSDAGIKSRPEDKQNFTQLMKGLREGLDQLNRPQTLTFAAAGWQRYFNYIELLEVMKYVDYMNVMTYDLVGGSSTVTGHHTALGYIEEADLTGLPILDTVAKWRESSNGSRFRWVPRSAERIIRYCLNQGVDPAQIVIGGAFYGRAWKGVPPANNGLYQPNKGVYIGWSAYHQIRDEFENKGGFQRHWDEVAKAPYLYNPTDSIFISYDDTASVKLKTLYAREQGLGGIMFWELGNDTKGENSLLDAIDAVAR